MAGQSSTGYSENEITGNGLSGAGVSGDGLSGAGISAAELRDVMGHFATGVTVVTSVDAEGQPVGTTANAVTSLSLDPPLVIVCFDLGSLTLRAVRGHGAFVVNVLAAPQLHLSRNFARRGLAAAWDGVRHRRGPTGSPRLEDVLAVLECTVEHALPGGDHEIIVGRVRHAETSANPNGPLVFFRGSYASLTDQDLPACG
jgi:flavin reductase (DIM6/NTAB) family NADH-FMN oxidoreductase RutF